MLQVSRDSNLKIPKKIENTNEPVNTLQDKVAIKYASAMAENKKFNEDAAVREVEDDLLEWIY